MINPDFMKQNCETCYEMDGANAGSYVMRGVFKLLDNILPACILQAFHEKIQY